MTRSLGSVILRWRSGGLRAQAGVFDASVGHVVDAERRDISGDQAAYF